MPLFPRFVPHPSQQSRASNAPDMYSLLSQLAAEQANASTYHQSPSHASPGNATHHQGHSHVRAFTPSFDVTETKDAFILEGELPGLSDKRAVDIEFTDHQTLLVKGKIEKVAIAAPATQAGAKQAISEEEHHEEATHPKTPPKPTVEDDIDEDDILTPTSSVVSHQEKKPEQQPKKEQTRYWVSERTIGSFQRTFSFPGLIDQDKVTATLEHGILTIVVPKRQKLATRKIEIH